ncbi:zinc finger MYM-type protein 1-like [Amphiura filiformis]|uniref:zinc finger MYM-type protein 1-like n=1 Tax=Amphiura filiformis TaxID=82378 RepID=UPI003B225B2D
MRTGTCMAFCFPCGKAYKEKKLYAPTAESNFITKGFHNWKDATIKFGNHEGTGCHTDAVLKVVTLPQTTSDIGETLSHKHATEKEANRQCFLKLLSNLRFLARQALSMRGDGNEDNSNFIQLFKLRGEDDTRMTSWLQRKQSKYTSAEMQNEMLKVMALKVLRDISASIQNTPFYTIMGDETLTSAVKNRLLYV